MRQPLTMRRGSSVRSSCIMMNMGRTASLPNERLRRTTGRLSSTLFNCVSRPAVSPVDELAIE